MNTGMALMNPTPARSACSTYHLVASSEPTGRYETMTSTSRSLRMETMSAVGPGAFSMIWLRYLPRPSWVMPRSTLTPSVRDLLEDERVVRLRVDRLGQVLADLVLVDVEGRDELDVPDVVAAQADVHQPGDEVVLLGVLVVVPALHEAARAVAHADDRDADLAVPAAVGARPGVRPGVPFLLLPFLPFVGHSVAAPCSAGASCWSLVCRGCDPVVMPSGCESVGRPPVEGRWRAGLSPPSPGRGRGGCAGWW